MYYHLFNTITDAIKLLERQDVQGALLCLSKAQQDTEDIYLSE